MSHPLSVLLFAALGLVVGSFLNVVISRLRSGESFLGGRSHCPHCGKTLEVRDLVPVLSFLILRGKCRHCGRRISRQYPAVELVTAAAFALAACRFLPGVGESAMGGNSMAVLAFTLVLTCFYIVIAVYDYRHYLILDKVLVPGIAAALIYALARGELVSGLLGALCASGFFLLQYLFSRGRWIGFGDVKFGIMLGLAAGFPVALVLLFLAYMLGAVTGLGLIAIGKKDMGSRLPFGVFLSLSAVICLYYGPELADWYAGLVGFR